MKMMITRVCRHQEKVKIYKGGTLKFGAIVYREGKKLCKECSKGVKNVELQAAA